MFERWNEPARRSIFFARYEANQAGSSYIELEHLLAGLMREDKSLWRKLLEEGSESIWNSVRRFIMTPGRPPNSTSADVPLSQVSRKSVMAAAAEAEALSSRSVGTVHLLLAILRNIEGAEVYSLVQQYGLSYQLVQRKLFDAKSQVQRALHDNVRDLNLAGMDLVTLPVEIWNMTKIQSLNLSHNRFQTLPDNIGELQKLERLDISFNNLKHLPDALLRLSALKWLDVSGNPSLDLPPELLSTESGDKDAHAILSYYFRTIQESSPLNEAKLVLVGRGGVGKSSLVRRLVSGDFDPQEKETPGICITQWRLCLPTAETVRLHVWDFGGQEIMHATHQFFLTERSVYILVLSGRENSAERDAEYWLKLIESFGGRSPVIVVLNKSGQSPFDINRRALERKYPIRAFVQTDCSDNTGIEQLHRIIVQETNSLEYLRVAFPARWFQIKNTLTSTKKNFLSYEEYRTICKRMGEETPSAQNELAQSLHTLGIALNYKDDPRLEHTHVLNPHWVTNGIYAILNSKKLKEQKGEIWLNDLGQILNSADYPADMRRFLLDLMKKFELCFSFGDDEWHYLIPELLDVQEPENVGAFMQEESLNFEYHYDVLPEGLLPRFIVRTHVLSEGLSRWRSGVTLQFERNTALIKADADARRIIIQVGGPAAGRRRLLAVIRSDFDRIHWSIRNLKPREMIPVPEQPDVVIPYKDLLLWEAEGRAVYPVRIAETILDLNVGLVLEGVDLEARKRDMVGEHNPPVKLFYSYSHKDEDLRNEMETHLKILHRQKLIEPWHDREIDAGQDWKQTISNHLEEARVVLLLVSANFIASDYCYDIEMKRALARHDKMEACVIPIIIRDVNWSAAPFSKLQALPKDGKAVTEWASKDAAWRNVSEGIERAIKGLRKPGSATEMI